MNATPQTQKMTNYRWIICLMLFFATTINYMDRQVLALTWTDFIGPEFGWTNSHYGIISSFFILFYSICMLFAGRFIDWMGTKKGFMWAIFVWSIGACLHAFCGIATAGIAAGEWTLSFHGARMALAGVQATSAVLTTSIILFMFARLVLALGEAGNFPASVKTVVEYFPKKIRGFATSLFNSGAQIGAMAAPLTIPFIARAWGWEMAFIVIGALGFVWMGFWQFIYKKPENHPRVNAAELAYILQDSASHNRVEEKVEEAQEKKLTFMQCLKFRQTWAFGMGKLLTDGVWWFFLFWTPAYLKSVYGMSTTEAAFPLFILYALSMISILGGWLPTFFVDKRKMNPYAGRMRAMLIFAFFPLLTLLAQPLGGYSYWIPILIIGIACAAHQAWSANLFSTIGDMFPKSAVATIVGIGSMLGGLGSFAVSNSAGFLFDHAGETGMKFMGFVGESAGYYIVFCICAVAYLIGWVIMKTLVPRYSPIEIK